MVRSAKSHHPPEEEDDDGEETAGGTGTDTSSQRDGKSAERKASNPRSKHSETEQRRRSKINERFQILRDLIPPNDQKRDKASLLLEVIEYIHFLQEKLQMYEGPCQQVWNQEPAKLISYRGNHGPVDSFGDHIQVIKNGSGHESNIVQPIANAQGPVEPEFSGDAICREADYRSGPTASGVPLNASLQPTMYTSGRTNLPAENIASQPCGSAIAECSIMGNARCEPERTFDSGTSNTSNGYSQGLLNRFTQALQTSGVDLTQASISVQLDIGKRPKIGATAIAIEDFGNQSPRNQAMEPSGEGSSREYSDHLGKRLKTGES